MAPERFRPTPATVHKGSARNRQTGRIIRLGDGCSTVNVPGAWRVLVSTGSVRTACPGTGGADTALASDAAEPTGIHREGTLPPGLDTCPYHGTPWGWAAKVRPGKA